MDVVRYSLFYYHEKILLKLAKTELEDFKKLKAKNNMKNYLLLLLVLFIFSCNNTENNIHIVVTKDSIFRTVFSSNGQKKHEINSFKNSLNGEVIIYDSNERISSKERYLDGKLCGKSYWYHKNGKVRTEIEFVNDTATNFMYRYYETGELMEIVNFYNGRKYGEAEEYYENQNIKTYRFYNNKGYVVYEKSFDVNGTILYERGSGIVMQYYYPETIKVGDTLYLNFVFALPPNCERELLIGNVNNKNEIINTKQVLIEEDFFNTYKFVYQKAGTYCIAGYYRLIEKSSNEISQWKFIANPIIVSPK